MQSQRARTICGRESEAADLLLRQAYRNLSDETGILVNLGLALMQRV